MKEMLGYQMDEMVASLKISLCFDPTTLIEIAIFFIVYIPAPNFGCTCNMHIYLL